MLSILIPTYNYNAFPLVSALHQQLAKTGLVFEIIVFDDASQLFLSENQKINTFKNTRFEVLAENIGRSKIRNLLSRKATFDWQLFLDADVMPASDSFISNYLPYLNDEIKVVNGGLVYQNQKPAQNQLLRWVYGKEREALSCEVRNKNPYLSFLTLNFLIHRAVFEKATFNETIPNLRHEDTLFSYNLKEQNISIIHIDNPIYHLGLDTFETAIRKENESLTALHFMLNHQLIPTDYLKISKWYAFIKKLKMRLPLALFFRVTKSVFIQNLKSSNPSLFIFDLYRLGYLCQSYQ